MASTLKLPVGIENFEEIRKLGFYYIDKTRLIEQLLQGWGKVTLFTRPRRFGKTLNMSMLKSFFEIGTDKTLFDGLYISGNKELCDEHMGKYPVIFLSFKGVDGLDFTTARRMPVSYTHLDVYKRQEKCCWRNHVNKSLRIKRWIFHSVSAGLMKHGRCSGQEKKRLLCRKNMGEKKAGKNILSI